MFVATKDIFENNWNLESVLLSEDQLPEGRDWDYSRAITIDDVEYWEVVYHSPGSISVFASCIPMAEFYIITHNLFLDNKQTIETFYSKTAAMDCKRQMEIYGVTLPTTVGWSNLDQMPSPI